MEIPEYLLIKIIRHAKVITAGYDKPLAAKVRDNARLLKQDIEKLERIIRNNKQLN